MTTIQTKAKAFGTFVSPTSGGILYVDPDHPNELHHSPKFTPAEAREAFARGLIEDPDGVATERQPEVPVATMGAKRGEELAHELGEDSQAAVAGTALDSRQTTAWPDADRVLGGAEGHVQTQLNAPPAGNAVDRVTSREDAAGSATEGQSGAEGEGDDDDLDAPPAPVAAPVADAAPAKTSGRKPKAS